MTRLHARLPCLGELVFPYARGTDLKITVWVWSIDGMIQSGWNRSTLKKKFLSFFTLHHKVHMYWPETELEPPGLEAGACAPIHGADGAKIYNYACATFHFCSFNPWNKSYANRCVWKDAAFQSTCVVCLTPNTIQYVNAYTNQTENLYFGLT